MTLVVTQLLFFTRNGFIAPLLFFVSANEIHTLKLPTLFCLYCSFCPRGSVVKFAFLKIVSAQMVTLALKAFWGQLLIGMHHCICCDEFPSPSAGKIVRSIFSQFPTSSLTSKHFLFFRQWLCTNYWVMFATNTEPFFSLFPWQRPWHAWRLQKREGDKPCLFHCAKMPSLPSTAILSQANVTQLLSSHNNTQLFSLMQYFHHS